MIKIKAWDILWYGKLAPESKAVYTNGERIFKYKKFGLRAKIRYQWCLLMFDYVEIQNEED